MKLRILQDKRSWVLGKLPEGCEFCARGSKLVLFVTGKCVFPRECSWLCPISNERRGRDVIYANERPVTRNEDVVEEAKLIDAEGSGVTGGEPLLVLSRTISFIQTLKENFGEKHHVHLYTSGKNVTDEALSMLIDAGLDELRIHLPTFNILKMALEYPIKVGVEVPVIPGAEDALKKLAEGLDQLEVDFLNLNELEFSESNAEELIKRGINLRTDSFAAEGSEETASRLLYWAKDSLSLNIHYCSASFKDGVQLRNRFLRRALRVAQQYEMVTEDGLLVKGVIHGVPLSELEKLATFLMKEFRIKPEMMRINVEKGRIETSVKIACRIAKKLKERGFEVGILEEYPTYPPRLEVEYTPL
ncbi:MAG: hypothetical protein QW566_08820 [Candidatus Jordarchaeales archaeon]